MKTVSAIPSEKKVLKTSLANLPANIAAFGSGFAFLSAQIRYLEDRCLAIHRRLKHRTPDGRGTRYSARRKRH
jgi:hypothetical protein